MTNLAIEWKNLKDKELKLQKERRELEARILASNIEVPELRIFHTTNKIWDADVLSEYDQDHLLEYFDVKYVPKKATKIPTEFNDALTIKENKPTFSWREK